MSMESVDALDEEDWWLEPEEREARGRGGKRKKEEGVTSKKKRRKISEMIKLLKPESINDLHTTNRQLNELSTKLQSQLKTLNEKPLSLKKKNFVSYKIEEEEEKREGEERVSLELGPYLSNVCPMLISWCKEGEVSNGSPYVIVLTSSAERASHLKRQLLLSHKDISVIKLCAKHSKIEDQAAYLSSHVTHIAVGTPNRFHRLVMDDKLSMDNTRLLIVDWFWRDKKLKQFYDIPEVWNDFSIFYMKTLNELVNKKQCMIGLL
ncbi:PREDICTED: protein CMSS1-like [Amphimedon queenslandica]|uniref:Uncharacterized protein n=1 Tax=Amphimedon queenslandica TaxID=400682 RepID=A0A1X7U3M5_AMPQE|nr:PREDICTED: protein CMSS1-like [Amphimedon queenslandica]|eukprot:XP_019856369.1 PREDICTED: protein CMSS1-like [Amphimedon queenslandica]